MRISFLILLSVVGVVFGDVISDRQVLIDSLKGHSKWNKKIIQKFEDIFKISEMANSKESLAKVQDTLDELDDMVACLSVDNNFEPKPIAEKVLELIDNLNTQAYYATYDLLGNDWNRISKFYEDQEVNDIYLKMWEETKGFWRILYPEYYYYY